MKGIAEFIAEKATWRERLRCFFFGHANTSNKPTRFCWRCGKRGA